MLPRKLPVISEDRYQLLSSDSKQVPELHSFVCSLDFCNAVLQVRWGGGGSVREDGLKSVHIFGVLQSSNHKCATWMFEPII